MYDLWVLVKSLFKGIKNCFTFNLKLKLKVTLKIYIVIIEYNQQNDRDMIL